jgi:type 1 fimbria pilin
MIMRHKILLSVAAASLALACGAGPALAQSQTGTVQVNGTVADRCLFVTGDVVLDLGELALLSGETTALGRLDASKVTSRTATLNGWCNGVSANMAVEALPILNTSFAEAAPSGFDRRIDYTATATAEPAGGAVSASDSTLTSGGGAASTTGIFSSDITVSFATPATPTGGRLISGSYAGSVVVTLSPVT